MRKTTVKTGFYKQCGDKQQCSSTVEVSSLLNGGTDKDVLSNTLHVHRSPITEE